MTKNETPIYRRPAAINGILSGLLTLAIFTSACAAPSEEVTVTVKEKNADEDVKPTVEIEEEVTWAQFDESTLMYKVDLDKFLKDKLKVSDVAFKNVDVLALIERIRNELGNEFYTKDVRSNELSNLDGKKVTISVKTGRMLDVKFYVNENPFIYELNVNRKGQTEHISRSVIGDYSSKYFIIYRDNNTEFCRTIYIRETGYGCLSMSLREAYNCFDSYSISFDTDMAEATIKLSKEDYDKIHEIMLSYSESDNLLEFLSDNVELLNKYLDLIEGQNAEYYEYLCNLINKYIEKAKILRYE